MAYPKYRSFSTFPFSSTNLRLPKLQSAFVASGLLSHFQMEMGISKSHHLQKQWCKNLRILRNLRAKTPYIFHAYQMIITSREIQMMMRHLQGRNDFEQHKAECNSIIRQYEIIHDKYRNLLQNN